MWSLEPKWGKAFNETIPSLIASGEVKYKEDVAWGLDKLGDALLAVQKGMNYGKAVVLLPEE
jgi:NADPH-dependent curcumin reductase CurA